MNSFTPGEKNAARALQADIPLTIKPFHAIADACGLEPRALIDWLRALRQQGDIRKFGAVLQHQKAGYRENALVMWAIPEEAMINAGKRFALLPFVSHCYERKPSFQSKYNLFTMLHAQDETIADLIQRMSQSISCNDFLVLESLHEYKKTSPEYF